MEAIANAHVENYAIEIKSTFLKGTISSKLKLFMLRIILNLNNSYFNTAS